MCRTPGSITWGGPTRKRGRTIRSSSTTACSFPAAATTRGDDTACISIARAIVNTATPVRVSGSVLMDSLGWGYVNHSSFVEFTDNVAYDVDGASFVTETGDEIGTFARNIAIHGIGSGAGLESPQRHPGFRPPRGRFLVPRRRRSRRGQRGGGPARAGLYFLHRRAAAARNRHDAVLVGQLARPVDYRRTRRST